MLLGAETASSFNSLIVNTLSKQGMEGNVFHEVTGALRSLHLMSCSVARTGLIFPKRGSMARMSILSTLILHQLEVTTNEIRREKEIKGTK